MSTDVTVRPCAQCGTDFTPGASGVAFSYCRPCQRELRRLWKRGGRIHQTCGTCGTSLDGLPGSYRYCSDACKPEYRSRARVCPLVPHLKWNPSHWHGRNLWQHVPLPTGSRTIVDSSGKRRRLKHPRQCESCGGEFFVHAPSVATKFCSVECRPVHLGKIHGPKYIPPRDCDICGEAMYYPRAARKRHDECGRRHHIARTMELYETAYSTGRVKQAMHWRYELVRYLRDRDGDHCALCNESMDFTDSTGPRGDNDDGATIDHIVPRSLGGSNDLANLQLAHWRCNRAKGNRTLGMEQLRLVG